MKKTAPSSDSMPEVSDQELKSMPIEDSAPALSALWPAPGVSSGTCSSRRACVRSVRPNRDEGVEFGVGHHGEKGLVDWADVGAERRGDLKAGRDRERVARLAVQGVYVTRHGGVEGHRDLVRGVTRLPGGHGIDDDRRLPKKTVRRRDVRRCGGGGAARFGW